MAGAGEAHASGDAVTYCIGRPSNQHKLDGFEATFPLTRWATVVEANVFPLTQSEPAILPYGDGFRTYGAMVEAEQIVHLVVSQWWIIRFRTIRKTTTNHSPFDNVIVTWLNSVRLSMVHFYKCFR